MNWRGGRGDFMCTFSGVQYYPAAPHPDDVRLVDIAHHLSRLCRFTGAIHEEHYSVAEHSVHVSYLVPKPWALAGLMHDAPEAYLADLNRPTKIPCRDYQRLEYRNWVCISEVFNLPMELPPCVKVADNAVLYAERLALMPQSNPRIDDGWPAVEIDVSQVKILALAPNAAKRMFLDRYYDLTNGVPQGRPVDGSPRRSAGPSWMDLEAQGA